MRKVIYRLSLELRDIETSRAVLIKRGDTGVRELRIALKNCGVPYPIDSNVTAVLYCSGAQPVFAACEIEDGEAVCVLPTTVSEEGVRLCELRLIETVIPEGKLEAETGGVVTSPSFRILSDEGVFDEAAVLASDSFTALDKALSEARGTRLVSTRLDSGELILVTESGTEVTVGRVAGARWHSGTAVTGEGSVIIMPISGVLEGDYYLNTDTGAVYVSLGSNGAWSYVMRVNGAKGDKGEPGATGAKGKDGTSVTVANINESAEDGGVNTVTFSDGSVLEVKNGARGDKGDIPVRGVDYWTEDDKAEIVNDVLAEIPDGNEARY